MWRCTGIGWHNGAAVWGWLHPARGERTTPLPLGGPVAVTVPPGARRLCLGVRRARHRIPCPSRAEVPGAALRAQCEDCAALDRSSSIAADTRADEKRPFAVYLAWFGPGLVKVGITGVARGPARLLEQGALSFTFLGEGPLMTARRTEAVLGAALGVPDRVSSAAKRAALAALPPGESGAAELRALYGRVTDLHAHLPGSLRLRDFALVRHTAVFGLEPPPGRPAAEVREFVPGTGLTGTLRAVAGHDLYLAPEASAAGTVLLDARLTAGWPLRRPEDDGSLPRVPTTRPRRAPYPDQPLF